MNQVKTTLLVAGIVAAGWIASFVSNLCKEDKKEYIDPPSRGYYIDAPIETKPYAIQYVSSVQKELEKYNGM